jgi:hypothetical protein
VVRRLDISIVSSEEGVGAQMLDRRITSAISDLAVHLVNLRVITLDGLCDGITRNDMWANLRTSFVFAGEQEICYSHIL